MSRPTAVLLATLLAAGVHAQTPAPAAPVAPAGMEAAFTSAVVSTYPDGRTAKLWLEQGGTYRGQGRRGKPSSGRWTIKGERICLKQSRPIAAPFSFCTALPKAGVTSWTGKAVTGETVRMELVAGR